MLFCMVFVLPSNSGNIYVKEKVLEVKPNEPPLKLVLGIGRPNPFEGKKDENLKEGPRTMFFNVDNQGNIFSGLTSQNYKVFNMSDREYEKTTHLYDGFSTNIHFAWLGPNDELYVSFSRKYQEYDRRNETQFKLSKFIKSNEGYILDVGFDIPANDGPPGRMRISPDNFLYSKKWGLRQSGHSKTGVFSNNGTFIKDTDAVCKTKSGLEFRFDYRREGDKQFIDIIDVNSNLAIINDYEVRSRPIVVKCTHDNCILLKSRYKGWDEDEKIYLTGSDYFMPDIIDIHSFDVESGDVYKISPYLECKRDDYAYMNIGSASFNYNGDVYVFVVYFDEPGNIVGNELIVLYRWIKQ